MKVKNNMYHQGQLSNLTRVARKDSKIIAVFLFGSAARNEKNNHSDIDICLVMAPTPYTILEISRKKLEYLELFALDIQIFQQLPLYIRIRILKEGKVLLCKDEDTLYKIAFSTITEFNDFRHIYREYLQEVTNVR